MITFNRVGSQIVGSVKGKAFSTSYSEKRFKKMKSLLEDISDADTKEEVDKVIEKFQALTVITKKEAIESDLPGVYYSEKTKKYYLSGEKDGKVVVSSIPMPTSFVERMLEAFEKGFDITPMMKFWIRLLRNPNARDKKKMERFTTLVCNYISQTYIDPILEKEFIEAGYDNSVAAEMATVPQTPFTTEGLIVTKKVVNHKFDINEYEWVLDAGVKKLIKKNEDAIDPVTGKITSKAVEFVAENQVYEPAIHMNGDDFYSGDDIGYIYRVGKEARLPSWDHVNCNSNQSCVKGLHCGNQNYINGFERHGNSTLNCFVDPANIGAVSDSDHVLRVLAFFPYSIKDREDTNRQYYFSSDYAEMNDERWDAERLEAIKEHQANIKDLEEIVEKNVNAEKQSIDELELL